MDSAPAPRTPRPWSVTLVAWLFVIAGVVGLVYHGQQVMAAGRLGADDAWVLAVRALAVLAGVLLLRGVGWARWLALGWLAWHVLLGAHHSAADAAMHAVLLGLVAVALLRPAAATWFRATP